ncbi:MAG TPA: lactonase family protein [Stellaceae bacterium]|nr:lactonase family protein [Stellaceae bacterium]
MAQGAQETIVYVSNAGAPDIQVMAMDRASGALDLIERVAIPGADGPAPTSMPMALSPDRRFIHAALRSEPFTVASFAIDPASGRLRHLSNAPLDDSMAYTTVDRTGRWLLCASYPGGKLTINPIGAEGRVTAPPKQVIRDRPKAHCVAVDAANTSVYCPVLAQDVILQLDFDAASGTVQPKTPGEIATRPGAGPRHLAFHPSGRFLYLITETTATIGAYSVRDNGTLAELQFVDMLAPGYKGGIAAADLHVTPDGQFLYGSERRTSSLAGFRIDQETGTLSPVGRWPTETTPRGFAIDPRGRFLLSVGLDSNRMTVYSINPKDGALAPLQQYAMGKMPNWIEFVDLK